MPQCARQLRGFTLLETMLGLVIVSVLLGSMGSLVAVTARLAPGRNAATPALIAASEFLEQFQADVAAAKSIVNANATMIEVAVDDRNGDGADEVVRYEWSGVARDAIQRVYNGGAVKLGVAPQTFALSYVIATSQSTGPDIVTAQAEASVGGWSGGLTLSSRSVDSSKAVAQHFVPTLPAAARSWTITRVRFNAQSDLFASGTTEVQIRTVDSAGLPTDTILGTATVAESNLSLLGGMRAVAISGAPPLSPGQEIAIVFWCTGGCPSMTLAYAALGTARTPPMSVNGPSWSTLSNGVIPHEVFATVQVASPNITTAKRVERVTVQMKMPQSTAVLKSTFQIRNQPEAQ